MLGAKARRLCHQKLEAQAIALDARGSAGGIVIVWDPDILNVEGFFSSQHTLSGWFKIIGSNHGGFLTNVYRPQHMEQKLSFLNHLNWLQNKIPSQN